MKVYDKVASAILQNPAYRNIITRVSVRQFSPDAVSDEELTALVHAAMAAPTGVNRQPWELVVVSDRSKLERLAEVLPYAKMTAHAPLAIVVCGNRTRMLDAPDDVLWEQDCSAATENLLLAAHALGLGGVWTCLFPHDDRMAAVREILNLPPDWVPFNLVPVGHPAHDHAPMDKWHPDRVHLSE